MIYLLGCKTPQVLGRSFAGEDLPSRRIGKLVIWRATGRAKRVGGGGGGCTRDCYVENLHSDI